MAKKQTKATAVPAEKSAKKAAAVDVDATAAKKAKEPKETKEPKAATKFKLTPKEAKFKAGGQVELIVLSLKNRGEATVDEITKDIEGKLQTRQNPKSVVSFYMTSLKKKGLIEAVKGTEATKATKTTKTAKAA